MLGPILGSMSACQAESLRAKNLATFRVEKYAQSFFFFFSHIHKSTTDPLDSLVPCVSEPSDIKHTPKRRKYEVSLLVTPPRLCGSC